MAFKRGKIGALDEFTILFFSLSMTIFKVFLIWNGVKNEKNIPAEQQEKKEQARFQGKNEHQERKKSSCKQKIKGKKEINC